MPYKEVLSTIDSEPYLEIFVQDNLKSSVDVLPHYHECYEILYMLNGTALQKINDQSFTVKTGDFILIKPSNIHETYCRKAEDVTILVIKFLPEFIESGFLKPLELKYINEFLSLRSDPVSRLMPENSEHKKIVTILKDILSEFTDKKTGFELCLKGYLYILVAELFRTKILKISPGSKLSNSRIYPLLKYIEENDEAMPSLTEAANKLHLNYSYCSRYFKQVTGKGFKEYIDFIKVCKAEKLILTREFSVTDAAMASGFSSVSSFSRTYLRVRGFLPGKLKKVKK